MFIPSYEHAVRDHQRCSVFYKVEMAVEKATRVLVQARTNELKVSAM